jgi:hypothetical protein
VDVAVIREHHHPNLGWQCFSSFDLQSDPQVVEDTAAPLTLVGDCCGLEQSDPNHPHHQRQAASPNLVLVPFGLRGANVLLVDLLELFDQQQLWLLCGACSLACFLLQGIRVVRWMHP